MMTYDEAKCLGLNYSNKKLFFDIPIKYNWKFLIKYFLTIVYDLFYRVWICFNRPKLREYKFEVSICSIFKNEAPYLREWLEYHILIGVDHFYLYDNNSEDDYNVILKPYVDCGVVTLIEWPENPGQISAYKHWYNNYRGETRWCSFLDLDEFICAKYHNNIKEWLKGYSQYPVVMVYWKMFGTSGLLEHDYSKLVIEQYTNSWPKLTNIGKLFYQTCYDIDEFNLGMMHSFNIKLKRLSIPPVNVSKRFVSYGIHRLTNKEVDMQINHYWSKAYNCYKKKHERGDAAFGISPRNFDYFLWHETRNTSCDRSIYRNIVLLKIKMGLN